MFNRVVTQLLGRSASDIIHLKQGNNYITIIIFYMEFSNFSKFLYLKLIIFVDFVGEFEQELSCRV